MNIHKSALCLGGNHKWVIRINNWIVCRRLGTPDSSADVVTTEGSIHEGLGTVSSNWGCIYSALTSQSQCHPRVQRLSLKLDSSSHPSHDAMCIHCCYGSVVYNTIRPQNSFSSHLSKDEDFETMQKSKSSFDHIKAKEKALWDALHCGANPIIV